MNSSAAKNKFGLAVVSYQVAECVLFRMQSIKWFRTALKSCCPCFPFSPWSASPTAVRYLLERRCVSRLLCASRRGTAKYVEIPEWRKGRTVTPGSFTSATTPAARLIANSKDISSAGKIPSHQFKCYKVLSGPFSAQCWIVDDRETASESQSQMSSLPQWQKQPLLREL